MEVNGFLPVAGIGLLGGVAVEAVKWYQLRESTHWPAYASTWLYWAATIAMIILGAVLAGLYGTDAVNAILAFNIGASAPAIIRVFAASPPALGTKATPAIEPGPVTPADVPQTTTPERTPAYKPSLIDFLAGR